ncbi:MAG TPA: heat-inducible transcriptional repressor HrcA [Polyangiaceae bacterium]|nr:heat-inducible transcriptional repressor HrcA [Polyangiaceae bacterium]
MSGLSKRERAILSAVVTEFTTTGEPVGSRTLAKKYGFELSAASIRNVLADLEERGFLSQPHSSAGRVPTEAAFRMMVDTLLRLQQLSPEDAAKIAASVGDRPPGSDLFRSAGRLLSDMTDAAAVLVRSPVPERTLSALRFMPTRPNELLAVMVLADGSVENRFIQVDAAPSGGELERLHHMLEGVVSGHTLSAVRDVVARKAVEDRDEVARLRQVGVSLLDLAIDAADTRPEMIIEGQTRLLARRQFDTAERLRELVHALEERERLVDLLGRIIETDRVQVLLGGEMEQQVGVAVSVVAAPYQADGRPGGAVGVIGPVAMDFSSVIPVVQATADAMSQALTATRHRS